MPLRIDFIWSRIWEQACLTCSSVAGNICKTCGPFQFLDCTLSHAKAKALLTGILVSSYAPLLHSANESGQMSNEKS